MCQLPYLFEKFANSTFKKIPQRFNWERPKFLGLFHVFWDEEPSKCTVVMSAWPFWFCSICILAKLGRFVLLGVFQDLPLLIKFQPRLCVFNLFSTQCVLHIYIPFNIVILFPFHGCWDFGASFDLVFHLSLQRYGLDFDVRCVWFFHILVWILWSMTRWSDHVAATLWRCDCPATALLPGCLLRLPPASRLNEPFIVGTQHHQHQAQPARVNDNKDSIAPLKYETHKI